MTFLTFLFYFSSIIVLYSEMAWIYSPIEKTKSTRRFFELSKLNKGKKWDYYSSEYKEALKSNFHLFYIIIWIVVGLFTAQWAVFLSILIFNFIVISPLSKLTKYSIIYTFIHWVNSIIGFSVAAFLIINHYHLHINTTELFYNFYKSLF